MKYFRLVFVHVFLLCFIVFLSFGAIYVYQTMPEVHKQMQSVNKDLNLSLLIQKCIMIFGYFILIIYSFYFFLFDFFFRKKLTVKTIFFSLGFIIIILGYDYWMNCKYYNFSNTIGCFFGILFFGGLGFGARAIIEYFKTKEKQKELERKNLKIELDMLRSQINPHFLFNTLNNIDALIRKDPERASELLIKLSQEMRYMLYDSNTDQIRLASEVEFIKDYIILQKLRIKNPDAIELNLDGNFENIMVPPMLFIPFIENVFKYCNKIDVEKAVVISLSVRDNELTFKSTNYYDPEIKTGNLKPGGIGLEVVEKRLDLLYPDRHEFTINKYNCQFEVFLKIKLNGH